MAALTYAESVPGLATLLPTTVTVAQSHGEELPDGALGLYPGEEELLVRAVPKRRREFTVARWCAREALRQLGAPAGAIPKGSAGEPLWPIGVVGSITHHAGYAAAVVGWRSQLLTMGVDAEPNEPLPDGVLELTASAGEITHLDSLTVVDPRVHWGRLLFCAKEAIYKAWYPVHMRWLGFEDVDVRLGLNGSFRGRLLEPISSPFDDCQGRWTVDNGVLLAALALPAVD